VIVSPKLLLNDDRFEGLWGKKWVMDNVINTVLDDDNPNTTQTPEYTKDKYNAKIIK
jgi:hypothetical protein